MQNLTNVLSLRHLALAGIALLVALNGLAQSSLSLSSSITTPNPSRTGDDIFLELAYSCAGTTSDCDGSVLKVTIPTGLNYLSISNSAHVASSSYNAGTREVSFTFVDPLLAGSSGTVRVRCAFPSGSTPNNFVATLNSEMTSTSTSPALVTSSTSVTALASAKPWLAKIIQGTAALNSQTTFRIYLANAIANPSGSLNFSSVTIQDQLPVGANFISASSANPSVITTYDAGTRLITSTIGNFNVGLGIDIYYTIEYTSPTFSVGDFVTNTAQMFFTPVGEAPTSLSDGETFELFNPSYGGFLTKNLSGTTKRQGERSYYILGVSNSGSEPLSDFALIDTIPAGIEVESILTGQWFAGPGVGPGQLVMEYQTNLNPTWTSMTASPINIQFSQRIYTSSLGLATNERITHLKWNFASFPTTFRYTSAPRMYFRVDPTAVVGSTITNCLTYTTSTVGANPAADQVCSSFTVTAAETQPVLVPNLGKLNHTALDIGDMARMVGEIHNDDITLVPLSNFWGACIIPKGFDVDPNTVAMNYYYAFGSKPAPTITITPNFAGTENTLFKVDWAGTGAVLEPGENVIAYFDISPNENAPAGSGNTLTWYMGGTEASICGDFILDQVDNWDINDNGNTTESLCYRTNTITVVPRIETQTELEVKGALDVTWTKFPANGESLPGGVADYQVSVRNSGNVALEDVILLNILPTVGDLGVIDPQPRNSEWSPNLAGPVVAPAGITVQYSTASNPCRAADGFLSSDPVGCQAPNWTALPPTDITTVKSIRFDFGALRIEPQTQFTFSWPMRTPVNVFSQPGVTVGDIAWNSFGFVANRADNGTAILPAEPVKTGIALNALTPGVIGDFVWIDVDNDGIQDVGEVGFDGSRIELYRDNGDGIANPSVDEFVDFTISANGGYYLFPNLPTGDYFVWFVKPPTYNLVAANQGADDNIDSDVTAYTNNGISGAISTVFSITNTDFNYSVDFGITPSGFGAVGNYAWVDRNMDGIQNESSSDGANGILAVLYTSGGIYVNHMNTANNSFGAPGYYLFDNVTPGNYFMIFSHPSTPIHTTANVGNDALDSDVNPGDSRTPVFTVLANSYLDTWDAGFHPAAEDCNNGLDDDLDGFIDCLDGECPKGNAVTRINSL